MAALKFDNIEKIFKMNEACEVDERGHEVIPSLDDKEGNKPASIIHTEH